MPPDLESIRAEIAVGAYRYTTHGWGQMRQRGISVTDVEAAICDDEPVIIEDYPFDHRGPSCLILAWADMARPLHIVVGYTGRPEVITAYDPDPTRWKDYKWRITNG